MNRPALILTGVATGLVVLFALVAAYVVARTPRDVLGGELVSSNLQFPTGRQVDYTLAKGSSAATVGDDLQRLGVVRSARQFQLLVSLMGLDDKLSAGDYSLPAGSSAATAIDAVTVKENVPVLRVTFPEGLRYEEMADVAERAGFGLRQQFVDAVRTAQLPPDLAGVLPAGADLQGYLFPDTYIMPVGSTPAQLVALMLKTFALRFTPALREAAAAHGLTVHQSVTMASIVEREAQLAAERPLIAGVFMNRLRNNDTLGADPTVQFALASNPANVAKYGWWKKELTDADLKTQSPYNTRLNPGIPPGPIASPGLDSLAAAANPATTKYYYFVADAKTGDGSHLFAETFEEHERNIALAGNP